MKRFIMGFISVVLIMGTIFATGGSYVPVSIAAGKTIIGGSPIFAAVQNVPMVGIIYDPKIAYCFRALNMSDNGDVRNEIYSQVCEIFDNMEKYKACLKAKADTMIKKADENDRLLSAQLSLIRNKKESLI